VPWKPKIRPPLIKCGGCGKSRRAGASHTCVTRLDRKARQPKRSTLTGPRIQLFACEDCGQPAGPGHSCVKRTDFRKRKRDHAKAEADREKKEAAERRKAAAAKKRRQRHDPDDCEDEDCPAYGCVQFRKGFEKGYEAGYGAGAAAGYQAGFADGQAAASGELCGRAAVGVLPGSPAAGPGGLRPGAGLVPVRAGEPDAAVPVQAGEDACPVPEVQGARAPLPAGRGGRAPVRVVGSAAPPDGKPP